MIIRRRKYNKLTRLISLYNLISDMNWSDNNIDKISDLNFQISDIIKSYGNHFDDLWMTNQIAIERSGLFEEGLVFARQAILTSLYEFITTQTKKSNFDLKIILPSDIEVKVDDLELPKMRKVKTMLGTDNDKKSR